MFKKLKDSIFWSRDFKRHLNVNTSRVWKSEYARNALYYAENHNKAEWNSAQETLLQTMSSVIGHLRRVDQLTEADFKSACQDYMHHLHIVQIDNPEVRAPEYIRKGAAE